MLRRILLASLAAAMVFGAGFTTLAGATPAPPPAGLTPGSGPNTQVTFSSFGPGQSVQGFLGPASFDPLSGYPNDLSGFTPRNEDFAGSIYATPTDGGPALKMYCIDLLTETYSGVGYDLGTWAAANVPNVGYIARLLNSYYPTTDDPVALRDLNQKAAAVQSAIWFFSDRYVLSRSSPLRSQVAAITAAVIAAGPLVQPEPPTLSIAPTTLSGPAGRVLGPFIVNTDDSGIAAAVSATAADMFADAQATQPIPNGTLVPTGQFIYLRSSAPAAATLQATATTTVPSGNVYLYDGNTPNLSKAQKLILAQTATVQTSVTAQATFQPSGTLIISKTIDGPGAGQQGAITITTTCDGDVLAPPLAIPANAPAGTTTISYPGLPAGAVCTIDEDPDGHTGTVFVRKPLSGSQVVIPAGGSVTAAITDTYANPAGALNVNVTIRGAAAGQQGPITVTVSCAGTPLAPDFVIPAGTPAGTVDHLYSGIAAGSDCSVTETADGHTATINATVTGSGQTVTVPADGTATANLTNTYSYQPGQLTVTKVITGPLAGQQGPVTLHGECDGVPLPDFVIPAGATGAITHVYTGIPAGARCTGTESPNGSNPAVTVHVSATALPVVIAPAADTVVTVTDRYSATDDSALSLSETIAGPAAGQQGQITFAVQCGSQRLPDFTIPAGTPAGTVSQLYSGLTPAASCDVTQTSDGHSDIVTSVVTSSGLPVSVPVTGTVAVEFTNDFTVDQLPATGAQVTPLIPLGFAGIVGGLGLIALEKRSRRRA